MNRKSLFLMVGASIALAIVYALPSQHLTPYVDTLSMTAPFTPFLAELFVTAIFSATALIAINLALFGPRSSVFAFYSSMLSRFRAFSARLLREVQLPGRGTVGLSNI